MRKKLFGMVLLAATLLAGVHVQAQKVHTIGDSTMANYDENTETKRGWGMYFGNFLTNGWTSVNYAKGGRDSRMGYTELWQTAKNNVETGDYVIIQFAHNDQQYQGMDNLELQAYYTNAGDAENAAKVKSDGRGTTPSTTYKECLKTLVDAVKAKGATPLLVSPVCRCYFSGEKIRRNGCHDLGDSFSRITAEGIKTGQSVPADDHSMDYSYQMKQVADAEGVAFIDMTTATKELYESYGSAKCHDALFCAGDNTHYNLTGALMAARLCAQLMKEQGILADNIVVPTDLSVSPASADLGQAYTGQTLQKELTVTGLGLEPESGTVTVSATNGVLLSLDKKEWKEELSIDYTSATLVKTFYAKLKITEGGSVSAPITVKLGDKSVDVPVTAQGIKLEGGAEVKVFWRLGDNADYELTGPATVIDETWSNMKVQSYQAPKSNGTTYADGLPEGETDTNRKTQRNTIDNEGNKWPANEIDESPNRYIEFGVQANEGTELKVSNIELFIGGAGGNGMMCHVYYSTDDYSTRTGIFSPGKMVSNTMYKVSVQPVVSLQPGQTLKVRVYPWYNGEAEGKTICLSDVTISGMAVDATGISTPAASATAPVSAVYSIDGRRLDAPQAGVAIVRHADGTVRKVMTK